MSTAPKRGLGRGLGALLGEPQVTSDHGALTGEQVVRVPIDRLRPNPSQPRKTFDAHALEELQASIAEHGVLVPILVRERGDGYEIIAGERRWRACAALRLSDIPAIVRSSSDPQSLEVAIIENLQRENLNALEEAAGIAQLIDAHAFTQDQVAVRLGKSRPSVTNALRLLALSEPIKVMIARGELSAGHAKALLSAPESARLELARTAVAQGLPVRALERAIAALTAAPAGKPAAKMRSISPEDREFEARLRTRVASAVTLRRTARGGSIEIAFAGEAELIRIAEILLGSPGQ